MGTDGPTIGTPMTGESRPAARTLAEAFLDDPAWTAIGPRRRSHRRIANHVSFAGILAGSRRYGARIRVARAAGGEVAGVTIAFEPGRWPIPQASFVYALGWLAFAGPLPASRGFRNDAAMRAHHPTHPHMYLWFIGVDPGRHGEGVGRALLAELHADSDARGLPTYLETATPSNVGFYERAGYEVLGEIAMPTGPPMWRMERPAGAGAGAGR